MKELMKLLYNLETTAADFTKLIIEKKNTELGIVWVELWNWIMFCNQFT